MFADLCGGPGGFTGRNSCFSFVVTRTLEYLLWRLHSSGRSGHGYGITLKASPGHEEVDWKIEQFRDNFTQIDGVDGTGNGHATSAMMLTRCQSPGDLYKEANIKEFGRVVLDDTKKIGVDLVVADGASDVAQFTCCLSLWWQGFDFLSKEEHQEHQAKRLLLCEMITMLTCLNQGK